MSATSLDQHFQNGKGESLARARAALKGRLKQKMMQDVLDELQNTEQVVREAMEAMTPHEEALVDAKKAFKTRLHDQIRQQAVAEVVAEVDAATLDEEADAPLLSEAKAAFKNRLFDHVLQQVLREVGAEIDEAQDTLESHGEVLQEAKESLKGRLRDQVFEHAVSETDAEINAVQDAFATHGDALQEAKESYKLRLRDQVFQKALGEVNAGDALGDLLAKADFSALGGLKDALKQRLIDQVFQQAIAEIDAEVDGSPVDMAGFSEDASDPDTTDSLAELTLDLHDKGDAFAEAENLFPEEEAAFIALDEQGTSEAEEPIIDLEFWDEDENAGKEASDASLEFSMPEDEAPEDEPHGDEAPEGDDSDFFIHASSEEAGGDGEATPEADWDEAAMDDLLDLTGDGAWEDTVPFADSIEEAQVPRESDPQATEDETSEGLFYYVYGILPSNSTAEDALPLDGIDPGYPIYPLVHEYGVALVSQVSVEEYGTEALAVNQLDPVWKEERAQAHQALVDRFSVDGLFLPVPFCTVYAHVDDIGQLFSEINYEDALEKIKGRAQLRVRLYRNVDVLHQQVVENSDAVQKLMADIKSKPKGGAHSIKKKMVSTIHEEEASLTDACTKDVHERLFGHADDVELGALEGESDRDKAELILDATYLVHENKHRVFTDDIERLVREYATRGFEFEVTGPEPPTLFSQLYPFSKA